MSSKTYPSFLVLSAVIALVGTVMALSIIGPLSGTEIPSVYGQNDTMMDGANMTGNMTGNMTEGMTTDMVPCLLQC
jgi:hypothetical protein